MNSPRSLRLCGLFLLCLLLGSTAAVAAAETAPETTAVYQAQQRAFRAAAARVADCVVTIETIGGTQPAGTPAPAGPRPPGQRPPGQPGPPGPPQPRRERSPGFIVADGPTTGLIYSADGLILTSAFNFVRDPSLITVTLPDGRRFVAELLARDEVRQLAMIQIDAGGLPVPQWIDSESSVRVGQWALALGRGFGGSDCSLTAGIISGLNRQSGLAVQTDAKLSPANFGGPLIDIEGRVIGIAVPMGMTTGRMAGIELYDSGIGFAIPAWQIDRSAESLAAGLNVRRGLLGISAAPADAGIRVAAMGEPSPALRAGLMDGDVITAIDGIEVPDPHTLQRVMRARTAGERITVRVRRGEDELDLRLVLAVPEDVGPFPQPETAPADDTDDIEPEDAGPDENDDGQDEHEPGIPLPFPPPPGRQ